MQDTGDIRAAARLYIRPLQAASQQLQAYRHFEARLAFRLGLAGRLMTATATPNPLQGRRQADATAIFDQDRAKLLQERQTDRLRTHLHLHGPVQQRQQPGGSALGKVTIQVLFTHHSRKGIGKR